MEKDQISLTTASLMPTFNPILLEGSQNKRKIPVTQLKKIKAEYEKFQPKWEEPNNPNTTWDYIMTEMVQHNVIFLIYQVDEANFFMERRKWQIFKAKTLGIGARFAIRNRSQAGIHRAKVALA